MLEHALGYLRLGWSVFPVWGEEVYAPNEPEDSDTNLKVKKPTIRWEQYQKTRPTEKQVSEWWTRWPNAGIALVTGKLSGVIAIDIESIEGQDAYSSLFGELHNTITQKTGKPNGIHLLFSHPKDRTYSNKVDVLNNEKAKIDVRADGGYIVIAPSIHPSGKRYEWMIDPLEMGLNDLMPLPPEVRGELLLDGRRQKDDDDVYMGNDWVNDLLHGVDKGKRNDACAKLAGYYLRVNNGNTEIVEKIMEAWNSSNRPPLEWKEVQKTIQSIHKRQGIDELGHKVGERIRKIQILEYPDGERKYNVFLQDHNSYVQMCNKDLGIFSRFKWRFMEVSRYIPRNVKQNEWEAMVNNALAEAEVTVVPEDETTIGAITTAINEQVFSEGKATDLGSLGRRIVVVGDNGTERICFRTDTIAEMIRGNDRLKRSQVGEILRKLGFQNDMPVTTGGRTFRCWQKSMTEWKERLARED